MAEINRIEQASKKASQDPNVQILAEQIDVARAIDSIKDTEGGKELIKSIKQNIIRKMYSLRKEDKELDMYLQLLENIYAQKSIIEDLQEALDEEVGKYAQ